MANEQPEEDHVDNVLAQHGKLSYLEIPAVAAETSAAFYEEIFGWQVDRRGPDHVTFFDGAGQLLGRWVTGRSVASEPGFLPYIYVNGVEAIVSQIQASGGKIVRPPYPEGNLTVATFRDPAGNVVGVWQET
jgi:hypothetical protein